MTARGRWIVLPALAGLFLGVLRDQQLLSMLSLSVLLWMLAEWLLFCRTLWFRIPKLQIERLVNGRRDDGGFLWAGRSAVVTVRVRMTGGGYIPCSMLKLRDILPENLEFIPVAGDVPVATDVWQPEPSHQLELHVPVREAEFSYTVRARAPGEVLFPGLRMILEDAQGFLRVTRFIQVWQKFRVLPAFAAPADVTSQIKRVNALPQHGIHRLQRAGMGSELLELREYVPGDPPKSIAWKVSARRDQLMTRQYESEVPVRIQLFVDGSLSTRTGGFGCRLLDQMTYVAASVARSAVSAGDPVGAFLFDERRRERLTSLTGERGFHRLLSALTDFSIPVSPPPERLTQRMQDVALSVCGERFPELLEDRVNQVPFTIFPLMRWARRRFQNRCRLSAVLAQIYGLSAEEHMRLIHDEGFMAAWLQHFLTQSGIAWMEPVVAVRDPGVINSAHRLETLSSALLQAVGYARDNEVFVILSDLLECTPAISGLLPALTTVLSRHHRIAMICPSPTFRRPSKSVTIPATNDVEDLMQAAEQSRLNELAKRLRRELGRLGVAVSFSGEPESIRLIQSEIELARTGRLASRRVPI
jgi:uncharacterized protein (DUF58 family)